jgi:hypothetical protein
MRDFINIFDAFYSERYELTSPVNPSGIICDDPRTPPSGVRFPAATLTVNSKASIASWGVAPPPRLVAHPPLGPAVTRRDLATALRRLRWGPQRPPSAPLLVTAHGLCGEYLAGKAQRAGRGREPVRGSRPGGCGPCAPLPYTTPAVFAAQRCERHCADTAYPVIRYAFCWMIDQNRAMLFPYA